MIKKLLLLLSFSILFANDGYFTIDKISEDEKILFKNGTSVKFYGLDIPDSVSSHFVRKYANKYDKFECEVRSFGKSINELLNKALSNKKVKVVYINEQEAILFFNDTDINKEIIKTGLATSTNNMYKYFDYESFNTKKGFWKLNPELMNEIKINKLNIQPTRQNKVKVVFLKEEYNFSLKTHLFFFSKVSLEES